MPCRSWCPICVQGKGRSTSHLQQTSRKPIIQVDFAYLRGFEDQQAVAILTAIDIETGLCMATMLPDEHQLFDYASNCIQTFIYEIGRPNSILQSDNEPYLKALLQSVANKIGSISVRYAPAYSSQSQGSIERLHRTLFGQVRILKEQIRQCYNISITMNKTPICKFGETILYMVAGAPKHQPKLENRFFKGIWLGKDTTSGESYIGIGGRVIKARTIRRQVMPYRSDQQLMDTINGTPWAAKPPTYTPNFIVPSIPPEPKPETSNKNISTQEDKPAIRDAIRKEEQQQEKRQRTQASLTSQPSTTLPTPAFAPSYGTSTIAPRRRTSSFITTTSNTRWTASHKEVKASNNSKWNINKHPIEKLTQKPPRSKSAHQCSHCETQEWQTRDNSNM